MRNPLAALRVMALCGACFIAIAAWYSPPERAASEAAETLGVADPLLDTFRRGANNREAYRILVLGSSEATVPGWYEPHAACKTIAACLEGHLEDELAIPVDARFKFVPAISGRRFEELDEIAQMNLDIDLLIVSYAAHALANETTTDPANKTSPIREQDRRGYAVTVYGNSPLQYIHAKLREQFYAIESRFKYSLAQRIPYGNKPIVVRFTEDKSISEPAEQDDSVAASTKRPELTVDPNFAYRITDVLQSALEADQDLRATFRLLTERAALVAPKLLVVFTPVGRHFFDEPSWHQVNAYLGAVETAASSELDDDSVGHLIGFHMYDDVPDSFDDPVHLLDFGQVGDRVAAEIALRGWINGDSGEHR